MLKQFILSAVTMSLAVAPALASGSLGSTPHQNSTNNPHMHAKQKQEALATNKTAGSEYVSPIPGVSMYTLNAPTPSEEVLGWPRIQRLNQLVLDDTMYQLSKSKGHNSEFYGTVAPLVQILANRNLPASERWSAAQKLGSMGHSARLAIPALMQAFQGDPEITVRTYAATALSEIDSFVLVPTLLRGLGSENPDIKQLSAAVFHQCGESTVPALKKALSSPDPMLKRLSCQALGEIGPAARQALTVLHYASAEDDSSQMFAAEAMAAIQKIESAPQVAQASF